MTSPLYTYGVTTPGGRLVRRGSRAIARWRPRKGRTAEILPADSRFLGLTLVSGRDTIPLESLAFTPSADSLDVAGGTPLRLTTARGRSRSS